MLISQLANSYATDAFEVVLPFWYVLFLRGEIMPFGPAGCVVIMLALVDIIQWMLLYALFHSSEQMYQIHGYFIELDSYL